MQTSLNSKILAPSKSNTVPPGELLAFFYFSRFCLYLLFPVLSRYYLHISYFFKKFYLGFTLVCIYVFALYYLHFYKVLPLFVPMFYLGFTSVLLTSFCKFYVQSYIILACSTVHSYICLASPTVCSTYRHVSIAS